MLNEALNSKNSSIKEIGVFGLLASEFPNVVSRFWPKEVMKLFILVGRCERTFF